MIKKITIIGAGNVATHLAKSFYNSGFEIIQVYSRAIENANQLSQQVNAKAIESLTLLNNQTDFYLICIKDDAIEAILKSILFKDKLIAHTSGSIPMEVFKANNHENFGIFYPLQTFSKDKAINLNEVPFCIEGNNKDTGNQLFEIALQLSENVHFVNSEQRKKLHVAAVFACNFTNYMYTVAHDITTKNDINFGILTPLIKETANKVVENSPASMQTGPARRNDAAVIKNHLEMLADNENYQQIYELVTKSIVESNN